MAGGMGCRFLGAGMGERSEAAHAQGSAADMAYFSGHSREQSEGRAMCVCVISAVRL